jgi:hypothetical protein
VTETVRRLAARSETARTVTEDGLGHYREFAARRTPPPVATLDAMRALVTELPAYAGALDTLGHLADAAAVEE